MKNQNYWYIYRSYKKGILRVYKGLFPNTYYYVATQPIIGPYWTREEARKVLKLWKS